MTILAGRERRNAARLGAEKQTHWTRLMAVYFLLASVVLAIGIGYLVMIYRVKCAPGINLMSGSSPLHFIYEIVFGRCEAALCFASRAAAPHPRQGCPLPTPCALT